MIHDLIEQKKKSQRRSTSRDTKSFQDDKVTVFEVSDGENKEPETTSAVFIPPWLRNSLKLNQKSNLSQRGSDSKTAKVIHRGKEQNGFESLKTNVEQQEYCKKPAANFEILQDDFRDISLIRAAVDVEPPPNNGERKIPIFWHLRRKESDSGSSCTNLDAPSLKKKDSKIAIKEDFGSPEPGKNKAEEKRKPKHARTKNRMRKHSSDPKPSDLCKNEIDFLLEFKAREALDSYTKGSVSKHREPKFLLLENKSTNPNNGELKNDEIPLLREMRNKEESVEDFEGVFELVKDATLRDDANIPNPEPDPECYLDKASEKVVKVAMGLIRKRNHDGCEKEPKSVKSSVPTTDDESDVKRFSELLSKNRNMDEKRKCLEEVRNYFDKKRRTRLTKRSVLDEDKSKVSPKVDRKEDQTKERSKLRDFCRGKRSKLTLNEEAVEKAVDETLQKFLDSCHFRMSPPNVGLMKKNILQAIRAEILEGGSPEFNELRIPLMVNKKINSTALNQEPESVGAAASMEQDVTESPKKDSRIHREVKKKHLRNVEGLDDEAWEPAKESAPIDTEKLKRLRKEFDNFLHSVQGRLDFFSLKLQGVILVKEDKTTSAKGPRLIYNFAKKTLEPEGKELPPPFRHAPPGAESNSRKDSESQTSPEGEINKKNVKIQTVEARSNCEQALQTDSKELCSRNTQTEGKRVTIREITELEGHEVSTGLYRMIRSKDAGRFYLYPEESAKQEVHKTGRCYFANGKKSKRTGFPNVSAKERRLASKEKERSRMKKLRRALSHKSPSAKGYAKRKKPGGTSEDSISCLFFRNSSGKKCSESLSSKKELTDENAKDPFDCEKRCENEEGHLGCFLFWNGEKISPGCDLKIHVENIVKEKLTEMTNLEGQQHEFPASPLVLPKDDPEKMLTRVRRSNPDGTGANMFSAGNRKKLTEESPLGFVEIGNQEKKTKNEGKIKENYETNGEQPLMSISEEKEVKNVSTQNSRPLFLSPSKPKNQSQHKTALKRKCTRRNIIIKPTQGRGVTLKKAQDIIRAVEEIKKIKLGLDETKNESSTETDFALERSVSTLASNGNELEEHVTAMLAIRNGPAVEEAPKGDFQSRLEKLIGLVDREVQTTASFLREDWNSLDNELTGQIEDGQKHLELIESVLGSIGQKERENLWDDLRDFIKAKIGRDINDEGAREVCIEIEQDVSKKDPENADQSVLARGHYSKKEGDIEVEIDLTLEDLAKILRQRQKKIRKRHVGHGKCKSLVSSSSIQSDFTKNDVLRYQKYLDGYAVVESSVLQDTELRVFPKNKAN